MFEENSRYFSWKTNGEIQSIESTISDTRLIGFVKLIQSIPFPQTTEQDEKEKYEVCSMRFDKRISLQLISYIEIHIQTKKISTNNETTI